MMVGDPQAKWQAATHPAVPMLHATRCRFKSLEAATLEAWVAQAIVGRRGDAVIIIIITMIILIMLMIIPILLSQAGCSSLC